MHWHGGLTQLQFVDRQIKHLFDPALPVIKLAAGQGCRARLHGKGACKHTVSATRTRTRTPTKQNIDPRCTYVPKPVKMLASLGTMWFRY
jgi:hypothetical protein